MRACVCALFCFWCLITGRRSFISFVGILMRNFPFSRNLAILFWKIIILLVINKSHSRCAVVRFCYHSYDYRPNWTPLSPITYTYILLTKCEYRTGRIYISARGLDSADRAQRGPYKKDRGAIFSRYGSDQAWLIRDLLHV